MVITEGRTAWYRRMMVMDRLIDRQADAAMETMFGRLGHELTLSGLLKALTGVDLMDAMRPQLVRYIGSFLDQGQAAWNDTGPGPVASMRCGGPVPRRTWRGCSRACRTGKTVSKRCRTTLWTLLSLSSSGWAWPRKNGRPTWNAWRWNCPAGRVCSCGGTSVPGYEGLGQVKVDILDYLAVRLVLERLVAQRLCRERWNIEASFDVIRWYFRHHQAEFLVR